MSLKIGVVCTKDLVTRNKGMFIKYNENIIKKNKTLNMNIIRIRF